MASLEGILNVVIPIAVILFFLAVLYTKLKEPFDTMFRWIGNLFSSGIEKISESGGGGGYQTVYKYE